eukprot:TRINITY_DN1192_c0_g1_i1.p1 TRINITY_DN1192_c0_g1~~TRINITY_DN1192_c0_g1_i1.p1  ORF type:complete len:435 (+),score=55.91 TRINITY_DN1192_c0_g1_i1:148-1452(+)
MTIKRGKARGGCDSRWAAIETLRENGGGELALHDFRQVALLGSGDMGKVYLVEAGATGQRFAMKVMKCETLSSRSKERRADLEREILAEMDHPFLPTLYGTFQTAEHRCLITEYCPRGDMWDLLKSQPQRRFSEKIARFYVAEVVLALEYLHVKGVVYRDLKPENILLQEDGHILLTDFDLSLRLLSSTQAVSSTTEPAKGFGRQGMKLRRDRGRTITGALLCMLRRSSCVKEPVTCHSVGTHVTGKSNSLVGTVEYTAPEIIIGKGHNSAVDWWTLGILLYEMLFGYTPFSGLNRQETYLAILEQPLFIPSTPRISSATRLLLTLLLEKDPSKRLGSSMGAADIKHHPFFKNMHWQLIRDTTPPILAKRRKQSTSPKSISTSSSSLSTGSLSTLGSRSCSSSANSWNTPNSARFYSECDLWSENSRSTFVDSF